MKPAANPADGPGRLLWSLLPSASRGQVKVSPRELPRRLRNNGVYLRFKGKGRNTKPYLNIGIDRDVDMSLDTDIPGKSFTDTAQTKVRPGFPHHTASLLLSSGLARL